MARNAARVGLLAGEQSIERGARNHRGRTAAAGTVKMRTLGMERPAARSPRSIRSASSSSASRSSRRLPRLDTRPCAALEPVEHRARQKRPAGDPVRTAEVPRPPGDGLGACGPVPAGASIPTRYRVPDAGPPRSVSSSPPAGPRRSPTTSCSSSRRSPAGVDARSSAGSVISVTLRVAFDRGRRGRAGNDAPLSSLNHGPKEVAHVDRIRMGKKCWFRVGAWAMCPLTCSL